MKENDQENEYSSDKNLLDKIKEKDTLKSDIFIELEDKNPEAYQDTKVRRETQSSFTKALLNKVQKEEEEELLKQKKKRSTKIIISNKIIIKKRLYCIFFYFKCLRIKY